MSIFQSPLSVTLPELPRGPAEGGLHSAFFDGRAGLGIEQADRTDFFAAVESLVSRVATGSLSYQAVKGALESVATGSSLGLIERQDAYRAAAHGVSGDDPLKHAKRIAAAGLGIADVEQFIEMNVLEHARSIVLAYNEHHAIHESSDPESIRKSPFIRIVTMHDFWGDSMCALRGRVELAFMAIQNGDTVLLRKSCEAWPKVQDDTHGRMLALSGITEMFSSPEKVAQFYSIEWSALNPHYEELSKSLTVKSFLRSQLHERFAALNSGIAIAANALALVPVSGVRAEAENHSLAA